VNFTSSAFFLASDFDPSVCGTTCLSRFVAFFSAIAYIVNKNKNQSIINEVKMRFKVVSLPIV
jgi:hypothetical protein